MKSRHSKAPRRLNLLLALSATLILTARASTPARADEAAPTAPPEPKAELSIPANQKFVNGTGQIPILGFTFKAPGFTSQGFLEVAEDAGPRVCFVGLNSSERTLTVRNAYKTSFEAAPVRITYAARNKKLGLPDNAEQTIVAPWQYYVSDPMPLSVKAGDRLFVRTFVPLEKDTVIGCNQTAAISEGLPQWTYGNLVGGEDHTLDAKLEENFKPNFEMPYVPFLLAGEGVRKDAKFVVAFGDSLTFQLTKDKDGTWFQNTFQDTPHANLAVGGDAIGNVITMQGKLTSPMQAARFAVAHYATDIINFYGHNDMGNGRSMSEMLELDKQLAARPELKNARKWLVTLTPFTHNKAGADLSTLTEADQTPDKYSDAIIEYNKEVRANFKKYGYDGVIDIRALLALGPDSPYWKPNMAGDGTHFGRHPANELIAPEARKILK